MGVSILRRCGMAGLMVGLLFGSSALRAHPHHWIDVFTEWRFGPGGSITGVTLRWLFDDYYSVMLVNDAASRGNDLNEIRENMMRNIAQHGYFLQIEQQGAKARLGAAEHAQIRVRDHRIEIEFYLPMTVPLNPRRAGIVYRVAEPTYYFEMLHAEEGPAVVLKDAPSGCRHHIEAPTPDAALVTYAAALGSNESGGDKLGLQFAETVTIRCD